MELPNNPYRSPGGSSQPENPYAAPTAELHSPAPLELHERGAYYALSPHKAALMSFLTLGAYDLCFWWRHWRTRHDRGQDVNVFGRTLFSAFYCFGFKADMAYALATRDRTPHALLAVAPAAYLTCNVTEHILVRAADDGPWSFAASFVLIVLRALILALFQRDANQVLEADGYRGKYNRGATARTYVIGALGLLIWVFGTFGTFSPDASL